MTMHDRFEQRLPDLIAELASTDASTLLGDVVDATARLNQRPAWRQASWWLTLGSGLPGFAPSWAGPRRVALVLALLLLALLGVLASRIAAPPQPSFPIRTTYDGAFVPIGSLPGESVFDTLVGLPDGRVLMLASNLPYQTTIYDPATGAVEAGLPSNAWRNYPSSFPMPDGRVLILGGDVIPDGPGSLNGSVGPSTAELFDPATRSFERLGLTLEPRWMEATTQLRDGRVFISGGVVPPDNETTLATTELFDPATLTFTPGPSLTQPRAGHSMATLADGRVLVVSGAWEANAGGGRRTASAELFDPTTGEVVPVGPLPDPVPSTNPSKYPLNGIAPVVALRDGRALIAGLRCTEVGDDQIGASAGFEPTQTLLFDPATRQIRRGVMSPHCVTDAVGLPNGQVLLSGYWWVPAPEGSRQVRWSGLYDPEIDEIRVTDAPPGGEYMRVVVFPNGDVLATEDGVRLWRFR